MGSLLSGVSFKEPTTVEDCDSTWETDSEPELHDPAGGGAEAAAGGEGEEDDDNEEEEEDSTQQQEPPPPGEPISATSGRPEDAVQQPEVAKEDEGEQDGEVEEEEDEEEEEEEGGRDEAEAPSSTDQGEDATEATAKPKRSFYAARDLYKYRHQYPVAAEDEIMASVKRVPMLYYKHISDGQLQPISYNFKDLRYQNDLCNLRFYKNKIPFKPDGVYIEEVLNKWKGDYEKLEHNHTYIQWLFPLREQGLNFYAKELTTYEIEEFKKTKEAIRRFLLAYKMMLEFFGIKLIDKTGNVSRASNWQERFQHLNESQHNYLRITRILKSLGELGYEHFKPPLVKFILHEALVEDTLPNIKQSALEYFVYTIRDRRERRKLLRFAQCHYTPTDHFIWGPPKKQKLEGSKPIKKLTSPVSLHHSCASKHKKTKDSKNVSTICNSSCKAPNEKKTEPIKNDEINDHNRKSTRSETAALSNDEKNGEARGQNPRLEETAHLSDQKEAVSHSQKHEGKNDENLSQDCKTPETVEKDTCESKNNSTRTSAALREDVGKDKNSVGPSPKHKEKAET